jgi:hypothetical protein
MRRRVLLYLTLIAMSACNGDRSVRPSESSAAKPSNDISDGAHDGVGMSSNPDFFFLPPMVKNPSGSRNWDDGAFNPDLEPTIEICASTALVETNLATAACPTVATMTAVAGTGSEAYTANWKVPESSTIFYRINITVGTRRLGYADVKTGSNASQLKNIDTDELIPLVDGRTLPIKFRVERFALCDVPGVGPCATKTVDVNRAARVSTALVAEKDDGIIFGAGTTSTTPNKKTVTVERCTDFRERNITDLPTFGPCVRVRVEPALTAKLAAPALVYSCDVTVASASATVNTAQAERIAMHRLVGDKLEALPHDHPDCITPTAAAGSMRGMFADLRHGKLKSAARRMVAMLAPRPLYAARFIDSGGGGFTDLSDEAEGVGRSRSSTSGARLSVSQATSRPFHEFQFLLPAKFEFVETPTDRAAYPEDAVSVSVKVTDLGGDPVMNARLRFSAGEGSTVSDEFKYTDAGTNPALRGIATVT